MKKGNNIGAAALWAWLLLSAAGAGVVMSCDKADDPEDGIPANEADYEFTDKSVGGTSFYATYEELRARLIFGLANPDADYNDPGRIYELLEGLAESQAAGTRGMVANLKAGYDFTKALKDARALPRVALLGVIKKAKINISDNKVMKELFGAVDKDHLPDEPQYNPRSFWRDFSQGKLDKYAAEIYKDIYYAGASNMFAWDRGNCEAFQNYCEDNRMRPIDLTLTAAPGLLQAGANLVMASSPELIQYGLNAFDFINDNGELLISFAEGNLDGAKLSKACVTNFKLLTTQLKSTLEETYSPSEGFDWDTQKDFLDIYTDWTAEQALELNKEVNYLIQDAIEDGKRKLYSYELDRFAARVREIAVMELPLEMKIIGKWTDGDGTTIEFRRDNTGSYSGDENVTFTYRVGDGRLYVESINGKSLDDFARSLMESAAEEYGGGDYGGFLDEFDDAMDQIYAATLQVLKRGVPMSYEDGRLIFSMPELEETLELHRVAK